MKNRKAFFNYSIEESFEAGIVLTGTEIKAVREGKINLSDSYALILNSEMFLLNCHISAYSHGNIMNHEPTRTRKLLMHKREINRLQGKMVLKGLSLIPLKAYFKGSKLKIEIGLGKGKKLYDKRESIKKKDSDREVQRTLKRG